MGVYVLGMHRSGTSAVTRVVNLLGVPIGREDRLMPVQDDNPGGFWEHLALMEVNDDALARLGGRWDAPPELDATADLTDVAARAKVEFDATYGGDKWVYKDPRVSLLLPFWRDVLGTANDAAIIVSRNPLDIAMSLLRRNRFATAYSLALWERYTLAAHRDASGLPVLVVDYDQLLEDPPRVVARLLEFLTAHDQLAGEPDHDAIDAYVTAGERHSRHDRAALDADNRVTDEQRALYDATCALAGAHDRYEAGALPAVSPSTPLLIAARRGDASPALTTLARTLDDLGEAEAKYDDCAREAEAMRPTYAAVQATLGTPAIGRVERLALGVARRARRLQQRVTRE
jgi:hypothetical protein